jgi:hypothetical protein
VRLTPEEFIFAWMQHIPDDDEHTVRSFGLFAPRAIRSSSAAVFTIVGRSPRPRPRPLSWNLSIRLDFGSDPLLDLNSNRLKWTWRIALQLPNQISPFRDSPLWDTRCSQAPLKM